MNTSNLFDDLGMLLLASCLDALLHNTGYLPFTLNIAFHIDFYKASNLHCILISNSQCQVHIQIT